MTGGAASGDTGGATGCGTIAGLPTASPDAQVTAWLRNFEGALEGGDLDAALALFDDEVCWRELSGHPKSLLRCHRISFAPNRRALSGKAAVRTMLEATVRAARPRCWRIDGAAQDADGIVSAWFTFETTVSVGAGYLRLEDGRCWSMGTVTATGGICC